MQVGGEQSVELLQEDHIDHDELQAKQNEKRDLVASNDDLLLVVDSDEDDVGQN